MTRRKYDKEKSSKSQPFASSVSTAISSCPFPLGSSTMLVVPKVQKKKKTHKNCRQSKWSNKRRTTSPWTVSETTRTRRSEIPLTPSRSNIIVIPLEVGASRMRRTPDRRLRPVETTASSRRLGHRTPHSPPFLRLLPSVQTPQYFPTGHPRGMGLG